MAVFKAPRSPFYQYDSIVKGHRVRGSAGTANKREAEAIEQAARADKLREIASAAPAATSMQFDDVAARYWNEVGQHLAGEGSDNVFRDLARLVDYFGKTQLLTEIGNDDVARMVAWRRGQRVARYKKIKGKTVRDANAPLIANATVNRSTTELLKKLFMRARDTWGVRFERWPNWKEHILSEPIERTRELHDGEGDRIMDAVRDDYAPLIEFAAISGLRQAEAVTLEWSHVNWGTKQIIRLGKGGKLVTTPITDAVRELLFPLRGHHPKFVFTYVARKTRAGRVRGQRYALTKSGTKTIWRRVRKTAGIDGADGFRFHDFRHDLATKTLRKTGNLKLVQKMLNHSNLNTTAKYAHVMNDEVAAALQAHSDNRNKIAAKSPQTTPQTRKVKGR